MEKSALLLYCRFVLFKIPYLCGLCFVFSIFVHFELVVSHSQFRPQSGFTYVRKIRISWYFKWVRKIRASWYLNKRDFTSSLHRTEITNNAAQRTVRSSITNHRPFVHSSRIITLFIIHITHQSEINVSIDSINSIDSYNVMYCTVLNLTRYET